MLVIYHRPGAMFSHQGFSSLQRRRGRIGKGSESGQGLSVRALKARPSCSVLVLARDYSKKYHCDKKQYAASQGQPEQV